MFSHKASSLKFTEIIFIGRIDDVRSVEKHGATAKQVNLLARGCLIDFYPSTGCNNGFHKRMIMI